MSTYLPVLAAAVIVLAVTLSAAPILGAYLLSVTRGPGVGLPGRHGAPCGRVWAVTARRPGGRVFRSLRRVLAGAAWAPAGPWRGAAGSRVPAGRVAVSWPAAGPVAGGASSPGAVWGGARRPAGTTGRRRRSSTTAGPRARDPTRPADRAVVVGVSRTPGTDPATRPTAG